MCVYQDAASDKPEEERKGICKAGEVIISHLSINRSGLYITGIILHREVNII